MTTSSAGGEAVILPVCPKYNLIVREIGPKRMKLQEEEAEALNTTCPECGEPLTPTYKTKETYRVMV